MVVVANVEVNLGRKHLILEDFHFSRTADHRSLAVFVIVGTIE